MLQYKPLLICVVGATAIGKTALSIKLAKVFNTEILSADSRQFYKEMKIGTAVPTDEELEAVPHHFIRHKSITEAYSVGDFETEALQLLNTLFKKHRIVILVGGSGLYVDAVVNGLDYFPPVSQEIREELNREYNKKGIAFLQRQLKNIDPNYYLQVDTENPHRLIRAIEVYRASGKPYSTFLNKEKKVRSFNTLYIGLQAERPILYARINKRVDSMMEQGLLQEVKALVPYKQYNALQTVGYKELFNYLDGNYTLEEAVSEIKKNTRRFAKRQGTWFRKNQEIQWFDYEAHSNHIIAFIKKHLT